MGNKRTRKSRSYHLAQKRKSRVGNEVKARHAADRAAKRLEQNNGTHETSAPDGQSFASATTLPSDRVLPESQQPEGIFLKSHVSNESSSTRPTHALHEDEVFLPIKTEPQEEEYTVVIQDPMSQQTVEGSFQELFCSIDGDPEPEDRPLVIDENIENEEIDEIDVEPPKKKPRKVLDIEHYKSELRKCRKELKETRQELRVSKQKLNHNDLELAKKDKELVKKNVKIEQLRTELTRAKREVLNLEKKLVSLQDELDVARQAVGGKINQVGVDDVDNDSDSTKCFFKESVLNQIDF